MEYHMTDTIQKPAAVSLINLYVQENGIKKAWLADKIGVSNTSFSRWMSGKWKPSRMARKRIEDITGGAVPENSWGDAA
jgi:ribosome-binding protein aMBF1 (putative translation factor)